MKNTLQKDSHLSGMEEAAKELYQRGEYAQALALWQDLLQKSPGRADWLVCCGNCLDALGDKKAAAECYLKAHKADKKSLPALTNLATVCYETGDMKSAEKYSRRALKCDSENLSALINLGNILYSRKDYPGALSYYFKAASLKPGYYVAEINLANTYFDLHDYVGAARHARNAAAADSQSVQARMLLGNAALETDDADTALKAFSEALQIDSSDPWIYNYLSQAYQKKSLWKEALENGWQAVEKSGGNEAHHINFGYLLYEASLEKADSLSRVYAAKWLAGYPENPVVRHMGKALSDGRSAPSAPPGYVRDVFDVFAPDFERVLHSLEYRAPDLVFGFLKEIYGEKKHPKMKILDAGCGTYSKRNFSSERYTLWFTRGSGHNAPVFGSVEQQEGNGFRARLPEPRKRKNSWILSCDLSDAYPPEAGVQMLTRTMDFSPDKVVVEDSIRRSGEAGKKEIFLNLMTPETPVADGNTIRLGDVLLSLEEIEFVSCRKLPMLADKNNPDFGRFSLTRILLKTRSDHYRLIFTPVEK